MHAWSGLSGAAHERLTVETDWAGALMIDVTWHPPAVRAGLTGTLDWDGRSDMACAVEVRGVVCVLSGHKNTSAPTAASRSTRLVAEAIEALGD